MLITENTQDAIVPKELWDRMQELRQRGIAASSALKEKACLQASPSAQTVEDAGTLQTTT